MDEADYDIINNKLFLKHIHLLQIKLMEGGITGNTPGTKS